MLSFLYNLRTIVLASALILFINNAFAQVDKKYFEIIIDDYVHSILETVIPVNDSLWMIAGYASDEVGLNNRYSFSATMNSRGDIISLMNYQIDSIAGDFVIYDLVKTNSGFKGTGYMSTSESDNVVNIPFVELSPTGEMNNLYEVSTQGNESIGYAIAQNTIGDLFIGGYYTPPFISPKRRKLYLSKHSVTGEKLWEYTNSIYPNDCIFFSVLPTADGGCYAAGCFDFFVNSMGDFVLTKLNENGIASWTRVYDFMGLRDVALGLINTPDNCLMLCGYSGVANGVDRARLLKAMLNGDTIWNKQYFQNYEKSQFMRVIALPDTSYVAVGFIDPDNATKEDLVIAKVDSLGNLMWYRRYGQPEMAEYGSSFTLSNDPLGGFVIVGRSDTLVPTSNPNIMWPLYRGYVIKTNCMGLLTEPKAIFTYEPLGGNQILFTNQTLYAYPDSIDGGYYIWDYGDGSPPFICGQGYAPCSGNVLTHQYPASGSYTATLTAIVCSDTSIVQAWVDTQGTGGTSGLPPDPQNEEPTILVYPNPAQNTLTFNYTNVLKSPSGDLGVKLLTLTGQTVLETTLVSTGSTSQTTISVAHLPAGLYLYVVSGGGGGVVSGGTDNGDYGGNGNNGYYGSNGGAVLARGKVAVVR